MSFFYALLNGITERVENFKYCDEWLRKFDIIRAACYQIIFCIFIATEMKLKRKNYHAMKNNFFSLFFSKCLHSPAKTHANCYQHFHILFFFCLDSLVITILFAVYYCISTRGKKGRYLRRWGYLAEWFYFFVIPQLVYT